METSANPTTLSWTDKVREGTRVTSSRSWICVAHEMCWMHFCVGFISFLDAPFLDITLILVIILTSESPWLKRLRDHTRVQMAWRSLGACHRSSIQVQLRLQHLHGGRVHSGCRITRSTWFETFPLSWSRYVFLFPQGKNGCIFLGTRMAGCCPWAILMQTWKEACLHRRLGSEPGVFSSDRATWCWGVASLSYDFALLA